MKKTIALFCVFTLIFALCACGGKQTDPSNADPAQTGADETGTTLPAGAPEDSITSMREYFDKMEYALYVNIFYEDAGGDYAGQKQTKEGTFAVLRDEYSGGIDRYYVWGYADSTRCCDFQWEFVPADPASLPEPGAYIKMTGTFTKDDAALDGYWFTDTTVEVIETYAGSDYDFDTTTMSPTLTRVEVINIQLYPDAFNGKTMLLFGRALDTASIQHPYYDEAWSMDFAADQKPATGTYLLLGGTVVSDGAGYHLDVSSYKEL